MLSLQALISAGVAPTQARAFIAPLVFALERFKVDTCAQVAAFLAQAIHESTAFARLEEDLFYRDPRRIAQIFRTAFDTDRDGKISDAEIEFARGYIQNPKSLASRAYAGRNGNGDEATGDGWRYRGRGLFQLTGRSNYEAAGQALGVDLVANPDLVAQPECAASSAAWFWTANGCNDLMRDGENFDLTTRRINGAAMLGSVERRVLYANCREALGC
jgi:putative chitinase